MFTIISKDEKARTNKQTAGAVIPQTGSIITEKQQLFCNAHLRTICQIMIKLFLQQGTER